MLNSAVIYNTILLIQYNKINCITTDTDDLKTAVPALRNIVRKGKALYSSEGTNIFYFYTLI